MDNYGGVRISLKAAAINPYLSIMLTDPLFFLFLCKLWFKSLAKDDSQRYDYP